MGFFDPEYIADYKIVPQIELYRIALKSPDLKEIPENFPKIHGLYNFKDDTNYMSDELEEGSWEFQRILKHEATHQEQYREGIDKLVNCRNELEFDAYKAEVEYGQKHGVISDRVAEKIMEHAKKVSQCK